MASPDSENPLKIIFDDMFQTQVMHGEIDVARSFRLHATAFLADTLALRVEAPSIQEVIALLRSKNNDPWLRFPDSVIAYNPDVSQIVYGDRMINLTPKENTLMREFAQRPNVYIQQFYLADTLWPDRLGSGTNLISQSDWSALRVRITHLRRKIGPKPHDFSHIFFERGRGYMFAPRTDPADIHTPEE